MINLESPIPAPQAPDPNPTPDFPDCGRSSGAAEHYPDPDPAPAPVPDAAPDPAAQPETLSADQQAALARSFEKILGAGVGLPFFGLAFFLNDPFWKLRPEEEARLRDAVSNYLQVRSPKLEGAIKSAAPELVVGKELFTILKPRALHELAKLQAARARSTAPAPVPQVPAPTTDPDPAPPMPDLEGSEP